MTYDEIVDYMLEQDKRTTKVQASSYAIHSASGWGYAGRDEDGNIEVSRTLSIGTEHAWIGKDGIRRQSL